MKYREMMRQKRNGKKLPAAAVARHQKVMYRAIGSAKIRRVRRSVSLRNSATGRSVFLE